MKTATRCAGVLLIVLLMGVSCKSIGRNVAIGAADGLSARRDSLAHTGSFLISELGRTASDSFAARLAKVVDSSRVNLERTLNSVVDTVELTLQRNVAMLGPTLTGPASDSLSMLLSRTSLVLRGEITKSVTELGATSARVLSETVLASVLKALESAIQSTSQNLAVSFSPSGPVGASLMLLSDSLASRAVTSVARATDDSTRGSRWIFWAAGGVVLLLVAGGVTRTILLLKRENRRAHESVRAIGKAVQDRGDPNLAEAIKKNATAAGVEPWLNEVLSKERLLIK